MCMCAFVGAVCHWWHTALQPAQWHARGGLGATRACCHGHVCARRPQTLRLAAWLAGRCWESGGHPIVLSSKESFLLVALQCLGTTPHALLEAPEGRACAPLKRMTSSTRIFICLWRELEQEAPSCGYWSQVDVPVWCSSIQIGPCCLAAAAPCINFATGT